MTGRGRAYLGHIALQDDAGRKVWCATQLAGKIMGQEPAKNRLPGSQPGRGERDECREDGNREQE